jgi:3-oxoacyl-(acyl-carrier-protein) synthase III
MGDIGVIGLGSHVPDRVITNDDIARWTAASPDWLADRIGIMERRYAPASYATSDLAVPAARQALDARPDARERLAGLIVATCTPDMPQPATAAILQHKLGLRSVPAFDLNAVCSGFLYAVAVAESMLRSRFDSGYVLVVGADMFSTVVDRTDRRTVSLFGDGAGAVLLGAVPAGYGIVASRLVTDGEYHELVRVEAGGTRMPLDERARAAGKHLFQMDGRAVRDYVVPTMRKMIEETLNEGGMEVDDIDRFVFHQANPRLLEAVAREAGLPLDRVVFTAPYLGNTAAASVPQALYETHRDRPLRRGERLLLAAVGGGLNAAATLIVWH